MGGNIGSPGGRYNYRFLPIISANFLTPSMTSSTVISVIHFAPFLQRIFLALLKDMQGLQS